MLWTLLLILLIMWALGFGFGFVGNFIHLLLVALDIERLRGDIMQRQLFPKYREENA